MKTHTGWVAVATSTLAAGIGIAHLAGGTEGAVPSPALATYEVGASGSSAREETFPMAPTLAATPEGETPPPAAPTEDDVVELGRRLFFDPGASHSKAVSCASCHQPDHGFSDPQQISADDFGPSLRRSQPLVNLVEAGPLHWDGEFETIEALVSARTGDSRKSASGYYSNGPAMTTKVVPVADSLAAAGLYASAFRAAFGDPVPTRDRVSRAIAAYVRTLESTPSPFDRYLEGDLGALTEEAARGYETFRRRARCGQCHEAEGKRPTFTDGRFHNTGLATRNKTQRVDTGRQAVTTNELDARAYKTPSLRDVALRAPYMHDGSFATLEDVVRYYAHPKVADPRLDRELRPFAEGRPAADVDRDVADLVAFLCSLTGETRAGLATTAWKHRTARMRLRLVDKAGAPWRGRVAVSSAGDVVPAAGPAAPKAPLYLTPDADGWIEVTTPATTHVAVAVPGTNLRPMSGEFVPDTCSEAVLTIEPGIPHRRLLAEQAAAQPADRRRR
jgi:cytochrome c peroxidase